MARRPYKTDPEWMDRLILPGRYAMNALAAAVSLPSPRVTRYIPRCSGGSNGLVAILYGERSSMSDGSTATPRPLSTIDIMA